MHGNARQGVFVTGGSSGIGQAIVRHFLRKGYAVGVYSRHASRMTGDALGGTGSRDQLMLFTGDVRDRERLAGAISAFVEQVPTLVGVVACAGINYRQAAETYPEPWFSDILDINVKGSFHLAQAAFPYFRQQQRGAVVFIASLMGHVAAKNTVAYAASKGAVIQLTKVLAVEWAEWNVRVNAITPGYLETPLTAGALAQESFRQRVLARTPIHRLVETDEVAELCYYLVAHAPAAITGAVIPVDGGFLAGDASLVAADT